MLTVPILTELGPTKSLISKKEQECQFHLTCLRRWATL